MRPALLLIAVLLVGCSSPVGDSYEDVNAIERSDSWTDWVVVGSFGGQGPFELTDVMYCDAGKACSFSHQGQSHVYDNFDEFELAVLRLESANGQVSHVVLRSKESN